MKKKNNAGFSIVEVLIALAIFMILMIPIVKGIVQALNMSTGSKELQYRNEFAEGIMEHVKSVNIDELLESKYYLDAGTDSSSFTTTKNIYSLDTTDPNYAGPPLSMDYNNDGNLTADEYFEYAQYQISGSVELGTKHEKYNYLVDVDSKEYAEAKANDKNFLDPNNLALGIVEDVDYTKVALIDDQVFNYDAMAENALKAKKLQGLKEVDEEAYRQALENTSNAFLTDEGYRMMTIRVSGNQTDGYKVQCVLDYYDESGYLGAAGSDNHFVEYVPYGKVFKNGLPNIYLLYNPCHYNGNYVTDDYITIDTSELEDVTENVNVFLVETASNYSQSIVDAGGIEAANDAYDEAYRKKHGDEVSQETLNKNHLSDDELYNTQYGNYGHDRDSTKIHVAGIVKSTKTEQLCQIRLYSNIGDNTKEVIDEHNNTETVDKRNKKTDSSKFLISQDDSINGMSGYFYSYMSKNNMSNPSAAGIYGLLGNTNEAVIGQLNDASEQTRGMYNVKVYLKKDSDGPIDVSTDLPILQGTKGGNES